MITIIGAGPVGSYAAQLLAKKGEQVRVLEEHGEIGRPVQCTGIVTQSIMQSVEPKKEFIINRMNKTRIHSPCGKSVELRINDLVIDRTRFDSHLADKAREAGADIVLNSRVEGITATERLKKLKVTDTQNKSSRTEKTDILIGADGPSSKVSRFLGNRQPDCWIGLQAVARIPVEKDTYEVYFGDEIPGFFGWVVPEDEETARIGIAAAKKPKTIFDRFVKRLERCKILEMQGGLIPKYDPGLIIENKGTFIVGDAATQVKATTGGGIVPGMIAAKCLATSIIEKTSYKKELKPVTRELKTSLLLRSILNRFNDSDYGRLIDIMDSKNMKKIMNELDRDSPSKIVFKSLIANPKILLFATALLRAKRL